MNKKIASLLEAASKIVLKKNASSAELRRAEVMINLADKMINATRVRLRSISLLGSELSPKQRFKAVKSVVGEAV